jgi:hypothetical protein
MEVAAGEFLGMDSDRPRPPRLIINCGAETVHRAAEIDVFETGQLKVEARPDLNQRRKAVDADLRG